MYKKLYLFIGLFILLVALISCSKKESKSVGSNPQLFNAVGYSGTILSSPDGITWTSSTWDSENYGTSKNLSGITYGNTTYVAVGQSGRILTSPDGITWTEQISGTSNNLENVIFANGSFLAVGYSGTILTSPDGITWTERDSGKSNYLSGVTFSR